VWEDMMATVLQMFEFVFEAGKNSKLSDFTKVESLILSAGQKFSLLL
jgi:hypothetical protein